MFAYFENLCSYWYIHLSAYKLVFCHKWFGCAFEPGILLRGGVVERCDGRDEAGVFRRVVLLPRALHAARGVRKRRHSRQGRFQVGVNHLSSLSLSLGDVIPTRVDKLALSHE